MNIKLIALDLDGTTLKNDHLTISVRTKQALEAAISKGILVVPATGRNDALLPRAIMDIPGIRYAITSNGAVTYDIKEQKVLHSDYLDAGIARDVLSRIPRDEILVEIFRKGRLLVERRFIHALQDYPIHFMDMEILIRLFQEVEDLSEFTREHGDGIEKINIPFVPPQWQEPLWERFSQFPSITLTSSVKHNMEINQADTSKGVALKRFCENLHIPPENVMAFGDNGNDIEMLQYAGLSFAMGNGTQGAKEAAKLVTLASDEDGVAQAIEKYVLGIS